MQGHVGRAGTRSSAKKGNPFLDSVMSKKAMVENLDASAFCDGCRQPEELNLVWRKNVPFSSGGLSALEEKGDSDEDRVFACIA